MEDIAPKILKYRAVVGRGFASLDIHVTADCNPEDVADLRAWLMLIDRQLGRILSAESKGEQ